MFEQNFFEGIIQQDFESNDLVMTLVAVTRITAATKNDLGELQNLPVEVCKIDVFIEPISQDNKTILPGVTEVQKWRLLCALDENIEVEDIIEELGTSNQYRVETDANYYNYKECRLRKL